jgi:hypothetical protein
LTLFRNIRNYRYGPGNSHLGGEAKVAGIAGTALSAPYRWQHEKSRGGTGGLIPQAHHRRLLDYADAHGIALT